MPNHTIISRTRSDTAEYAVVAFDGRFTDDADPLAAILAEDGGGWRLVTVETTKDGRPALIVSRPRKPRQLDKKRMTVR